MLEHAACGQDVCTWHVIPYCTEATNLHIQRRWVTLCAVGLSGPFRHGGQPSTGEQAPQPLLQTHRAPGFPMYHRFSPGPFYRCGGRRILPCFLRDRTLQQRRLSAGSTLPRPARATCHHHLPTPPDAPLSGRHGGISLQRNFRCDTTLQAGPCAQLVRAFATGARLPLLAALPTSTYVRHSHFTFFVRVVLYLVSTAHRRLQANADGGGAIGQRFAVSSYTYFVPF